MEVIDVLKYKVVPAFSNYCNKDKFAEAAISPVNMSRLFMLELNIGTILACSGKKMDFLTWREKYKDLMIKRELKPEIRCRHEDYMDELANTLIS